MKYIKALGYALIVIALLGILVPQILGSATYYDPNNVTSNTSSVNATNGTTLYNTYKQMVNSTSTPSRQGNFYMQGQHMG